MPPDVSEIDKPENVSAPLALVIVCVVLAPWNLTVRPFGLRALLEVLLSVKLPMRMKSAALDNLNVLPFCRVKLF